ncbi:MAG: hypothetical protein ACR2J0_02665 [Mycobacteriales bacterium]
MVVTTELELRKAVAGDVDDLTELADQRRVEYERFQPRFWRPADDARTRQGKFFVSVLTDPDVMVVVGRDASALRGFAIARLVPSPPVYDPGGLTCWVDDFAVSEAVDWPYLGAKLLEFVRDWSAQRGGVQVVVVTAHLDTPKREALRAAGLSIASEWWVG